ncbi:hypothetical protein [Sulfurimonas microaerophilic]|uniref:hypothetical protein n=1 Tax=Sulfurimonas microaerophilic TaxID=3058392 RepID=UPI0027149941|nr:hypothetical protein [Sulfurimonas sp. hsl 1-7]
MKQKVNITIISFITLISLSGCTSNGGVTPTTNNELNSVSPTTSNKKAGFMQNSLDNWLKNDWSPAVEQDPEIQKKYMTKEVVTKKEDQNLTTQEVKYTESKTKGFTLQEYVDKIGAYQKAKPSDENSSHLKQMESLPAIGK